MAADAAAVYHPTAGRFLQRDPEPGGNLLPARMGRYRDGVNLYEYVAGAPCSHVDPHGLAYVTVTPLPGWYEEPGLRGPGQVRWGSDVEATCQCTRPEAGHWQMVDVRADIQVAITMNPRRFGQPDADGKPLTETGVLGHEQQHMSKIVAALDNVRGVVMGLLERAEYIEFQAKGWCEKYLNLKLRPDVQQEVDKAASAAAIHAGDRPDATEAAGYPVDRRQYDPEPGSDTERKGEHVPWPRPPWQSNPVR